MYNSCSHEFLPQQHLQRRHQLSLLCVPTTFTYIRGLANELISNVYVSLLPSHPTLSKTLALILATNGVDANSEEARL